MCVCGKDEESGCVQSLLIGIRSKRINCRKCFSHAPVNTECKQTIRERTAYTFGMYEFHFFNSFNSTGRFLS